MAVLPESVVIGKCYLTRDGRVRHVLSIEGGKVLYEVKDPKAAKGGRPRMATIPAGKFTADVEREVSCNWTPEMEE